MELIIGNKFTKVTGTKEEILAVEDLLTVDIPDAWRSPRFKMGMWDGTKCYFTRINNVFPMGLSYYVAEKFPEANVKDSRIRPPTGKEVQINIDLREEYQAKIVDTMISKTFGIVNAATNAGKTDMAAAVIARLMVDTVFLVHTKELLSQAVDRIELRLGLPKGSVGCVGDGRWEEGLITVAMVQTLHKRRGTKQAKNLFKRAKMVLIDECHHLVSDQWSNLAKKFINAYWRYGLSGTIDLVPYKYLKIASHVGIIISKVSNEQLIGWGFSSKPEIFIYKIDHSDYGTYLDTYKFGVTDNKKRNNVIAKELKESIKRKEQAICIVKFKRHVDQITKICLKLGIPAVGIWGNDSERAEKFKAFCEGKILALIATPLFDEGVDIPTIYTYINGAGGQDFKKTLQRIGRGLRKKSVNNTLRVVDFYDNEPTYLLAHSKSRLSTMKKEGFKITVMKL